MAETGETYETSVTVGSHKGSNTSDLMTKRYLQLTALLQFCKSI